MGQALKKSTKKEVVKNGHKYKIFKKEYQITCQAEKYPSFGPLNWGCGKRMALLAVVLRWQHWRTKKGGPQVLDGPNLTLIFIFYFLLVNNHDY